jgi:hypothetical protein
MLAPVAGNLNRMERGVQQDTIVRVDLVLTLVFAVTAVYAAVVFSTTAQWVGAVTAMTLFAIGVFAFLWSYWAAVQKSRTLEIGVAQLYLLLGDAVPNPVKRTMNTVLVAQFAIALSTTLMRLDGPDGNPGSSLAVGFLVPMLGFGLNGLWAVTHGTFHPRTELRQSSEKIGQNADHG